ncbi:MAG: ATP-binding protein [Candidatus Dormiibacterota bacterium]
MVSSEERFEFHATLNHLDEGLETLHDSVQRLRESIGRGPDDRNLMLFETALAEIGANVLTHGRPAGDDHQIEYALWTERQAALASFVDQGPPVHDLLNRGMPDPLSESGRGLAMANSLLDELGYRRDGELNRWRLVKRL